VITVRFVRRFNDSTPQGKRGPGATAIKTKKYVVCNDIERKRSICSMEEALARDYRSLMVPIKTR
jgi:hypothetical protein